MKPTALAVFLCLCLVTGCSLYKKSSTTPPRAEASPLSDKQSAEASASPQPATDQSKAAANDTEIKDDLHTPAKGTPEREAIMEILRAEVKKETGEDVVFVVNLLNVHNGWAWVDVTPNRKNGTAL